MTLGAGIPLDAFCSAPLRVPTSLSQVHMEFQGGLDAEVEGDGEMLPKLQEGETGSRALFLSLSLFFNL